MKHLVSLIKLSQPDLMLVSSEGMKFSTWRLLLALHSPLLADLLQTSRPSEEGILAISLPLSYTSVSSMLTILSEGGNLDNLGEVAQLLSLWSHTSAPKTDGSAKFEKSTGRNPRSIFKVNSTDKDSCKINSSVVKKPAFEILSKSETVDLNKVKGDSGKSIWDFKAKHESESFDNVLANQADNAGQKVMEMVMGELNNGDKNIEKEEDFEEETSDTKADDGDSKQIEEGKKVIWCGNTGPLSPGLTFPNYDSMMAALDEWGQANFSPMITRSSGNIFRQHTFRCPHSQKKRQKEPSLRIRQTKKVTLEYVDCPFLIDAKVNADGSYIISRAETKHRGHEVSEEQFQKYRRSRRLTSDQKDVVLALMNQGDTLPEIAKILSDFTGRNYQREEVRYLVKKLRKQFLLIDPDTGEEKLELGGVDGLPLSQRRRSAFETET